MRRPVSVYVEATVGILPAWVAIGWIYAEVIRKRPLPVDIVVKRPARIGGLKLLSDFGPAGARYYDKRTKQTVILTIAEPDTYGDGHVWAHLSVSFATRAPSYYELRQAKEIFLGPELEAIQKFPKKAEHVNIHPNCLHLWSCLTGDVLPDFTLGMGTI